MKNLEKNFKKLPDAPGIYLFFNKEKELIYVGKATSLRNRVRSYWNGKKTPRPIELMLHKVHNIKFKKTESVLEAIILEANHIKEYKPKYNVMGRDDKSWNYIVITKTDYPEVKTIRQHEFKQLKKQDLKQYEHVFGPYPGLNTKAAMKILRRMFQFSTCKPNAKRPCLYNQMGECLGVCTGDISVTDYKKKVIKPLVSFLKGRKKQLIKSLEVAMRKASKTQEYEEAGRLRNQISALKKIHDMTLLNKSFIAEQFETQSKIEGYDISNLGPTGLVGSMVVFVNGEPDKKQYRKFKIRTVEGQSDVGALAEVLERRLKHNEWSLPDVFLVDGGKPQVNKAVKVLKEMKINRPVVGIAKGPDRKKNEIILGSKDKKFVRWIYQNTKTLIKVRDEAHRFAIKYQRQLRKIK